MNIPNALLAAAILAAAAPAATAQQTINKNAKVAPDATVEVTNVQGTIEITAWDRNDVDLVAVLESPKDQLEYEASERHVRIEVERELGKYKSDGDDARLTLRVPTGARVIAADSGIRHSEPLGLVPEIWVGDFDSTDGDLALQYAEIPRLEYPAEKALTDGELALQMALDQGATEIVMVGALGGERADHAWAHVVKALALALNGR